MSAWRVNWRREARWVCQLGKAVYSKLIPPSYRERPAAASVIFKWILIGLLIRFLFMPLAAHSDLIATYGRASRTVYQQGFFFPGLGQILVHYFHVLFLEVLKPCMPYGADIWKASATRLGADETIWMRFIDQPYIYRTLFLLKVPYLLFDFGSAFLLLHIIGERKKGLRAFKFWMINPVGIFVTYIFARFEVIPIFLILSSLYYAQNKKILLAALMLGLSIATRFYSLMLLLPLVLILGQRMRERFRLLVLGLLPLVGLQLPYLITGRATEAGVMARSSFGDYLLSAKFHLLSWDTLFIFVVGYTLILLHTYYNSKYSFTSLWKRMFTILLLFFALSYFHPQYFMWIAPFMALQIAEDRKFIGLYAIQVLCVMIYSFQWDRALAGYLFAPISRFYFTNIASPYSLISLLYPAGKLIGIFRSILSATCLWMMYLAFRSLSSKGKVTGPEGGS